MNNIEVVICEVYNSLELLLTEDDLVHFEEKRGCDIFVFEVDEETEIHCTIYYETDELSIKLFEDEECTENVIVDLEVVDE